MSRESYLKAEVVNATPLDLTFTYDVIDPSGHSHQRREGIPLPSLKAASLDLPDGEIKTIRVAVQSASKMDLGRFEFEPGDPPLIITPDSLQWNAKEVLRKLQQIRTLPQIRIPGPEVSFSNETDLHVDLYYKDEKEESYLTIAPRQKEGRYYVHCACIARAALTGELLGMFVTGLTPTQEMRITPAFRDDLYKMRSQGLLPKMPFAPFRTLGLRRGSNPTRDDQAFITATTVRTEFSKANFNGLKGRVLRDIEIAGVLLRWSGSNPILRNYYGAGNAANFKSIKIFADRMTVEDHLHFPGTDVTIYARELEFSGPGCIDTTPLPFDAKAQSEFLTKDPDDDRTNDQMPADKDGKPTYLARDGAQGQKAGDINLHFWRLIDEPGNPATKRFICRGGKGQAAEAGGSKAYVKKDGYLQTYTESPSFTAQEVEQFFEEKTRRGGRCYNWRWPGEVDWPWKMKVDHQAGNILNTPKEAKQHKGKAVAVTIVGVCADLVGAFVERAFLPERKYEVWDGLIPFSKLLDLAAKAPITRPCDGRDAYSGGWPGDGGDGGKITFNHPMLKNVRGAGLHAGSAVPVCDASAGDPGDPTSAVEGKEPPGPTPAYEMNMLIIRHSAVEYTGGTPKVTLTEVSPKPGQGVNGRQIYVGDSQPVGPHEKRRSQANNGSVEHQTIGDISWARPAAAGAVLRYAQTAYRNGFRDEAVAALDPYFALRRSARDNAVSIDGRLGLIFARMAVLRDNLASNLDYYGNPPGWVPRLNALTNLKLLESVRKAAYGTFYFAEKMLSDYDDLMDAREASKQTSEALKEEIAVAQKTLKTAYDELPNAMKELDEVQQQVGPVKEMIDVLRQRALDKTKSKVQAQRIFSAAMQMAGGVFKGLPVGQPFSGLVGSAFDSASQVDWNAPDALGTVRSSINNFGKAVTDFSKDKKDQVAALASGGLSADGTQKEDEVTKLSRQLEDEESKPKEDAKAAEQVAEVTWKEFKVSERARLDGLVKGALSAIVYLKKKKPEQTGQANALLSSLEEQRKTIDEKNNNHFRSQLLEYRKQQVALQETARSLAKAENNKLRKTAAAANKGEAERVDKIAGIHSKLNTAKRDSEDQKKLVERRMQTANAVMSNIEGLGSGLGNIGNGIVTLVTPLTTDDPTWKRLADKMLATDPDLASRGKELTKKLGEILEKKRKATDKLLFWRQQASTSVATIAANLGALTELSRQRQLINQGLDPAVQGYLQEVKERAKDALSESIYWFVKSYQYEFLRDVDDSFYNFDSWTDKLRKQEIAKQSAITPKRTDNQPPKRDRDLILSKEDFVKIGDEVFKAETANVARQLLIEREKRGTKFKGDYTNCVLERSNQTEKAWMKEMLDTLLKNGQVSFSFVEHFKKGSFASNDARVMGVVLKEFKIKTDDPNLSLTLRIRHSGRSIIGRGQGQDRIYFVFVSGRDDDPISWQFVYNQSNVGKPETEISKSSTEDTVDPGIRAFLDASLPEFKEYQPGLFSDFILRIEDYDDYKKNAIKSIDKVVMDVSISQA